MDRMNDQMTSYGTKDRVSVKAGLWTVDWTVDWVAIHSM